MHTPTYHQLVEIINILKRVANQMNYLGPDHLTNANTAFLMQMCMPVLSKYAGIRFMATMQEISRLSEEFQDRMCVSAPSEVRHSGQSEVLNIFQQANRLNLHTEKLSNLFREWSDTSNTQDYEDMCRILSPLGYNDYEVMGRELARGKNDFFLFNLEDRHGMAGRLAQVFYNLMREGE